MTETMDNRILYKPANRWKRIISYLLDVVPFVIIIYTFFSYFFPGFQEAMDEHATHPRQDLENFKEYMKFKAQVRNTSLIVWSIYSLVMDASPLHGTIAKRLLGLRVIDENGNHLSIRKSVTRNFAKVIGTVPLGLGMFWIFFDKYKRPLHDKVSATFVVEIETNIMKESNELNDYIQDNRLKFTNTRTN